MTGLSQSHLEHTLNGLSEKGWAVCDNFISKNQVENLRELIQRDFAAGYFKKAGFGRGAGFRIDPQLRADYLRWLDDYKDEPVIAEVSTLIDEFRVAINRNLFLGLTGIEAHLTRYPPGAGYAKHVDRFSDKDSRTLSLVLYLNEDDWSERDGGVLRIFDRACPTEPELDVLPIGGRLVTFLSDKIWHEVRPNTRDRFSLTGWYLRSQPIS